MPRVLRQPTWEIGCEASSLVARNSVSWTRFREHLGRIKDEGHRSWTVPQG
jgi:hypothetical protein